MDPGSDLIETLLKTTGLSCDDLLAKLQQYKTSKTKHQEKEAKPLPNDSVILDTVSSTVDCNDNCNKTNEITKDVIDNENGRRIEDIETPFDSNAVTRNGKNCVQSADTNTRKDILSDVENCVPSNCVDEKIAENECSGSFKNSQDTTRDNCVDHDISYTSALEEAEETSTPITPVESEVEINRVDNGVTTDTGVKINSADKETKTDSADGEATVETKVEVYRADNKPTEVKSSRAESGSTTDTVVETNSAEDAATVETEVNIHQADDETTEVKSNSANNEVRVEIEVKSNSTDKVATIDTVVEVNSADGEAIVETEVEIYRDDSETTEVENNIADNEARVETLVESNCADREAAIDTVVEINGADGEATVETEVEIYQADNETTEVITNSGDSEATVETEVKSNSADSEVGVETEVKNNSADKETFDTVAEVDSANGETIEVERDSADNEARVETQLKSNSADKESEVKIYGADNETRVENNGESNNADKEATIDPAVEINRDDKEAATDTVVESNWADSDGTVETEIEIYRADNETTEVKSNSVDSEAGVETEVRNNSPDKETIDTVAEIDSADGETTVETEATISRVDNQTTEVESNSANSEARVETEVKSNGTDKEATIDIAVKINSVDGEAVVETEDKIYRADNEITEVKSNNANSEARVETEINSNSTDKEATIDTAVEINSVDGGAIVETEDNIYRAENETAEVESNNADKEATVDTVVEIDSANSKATVETEVKISGGDNETIKVTSNSACDEATDVKIDKKTTIHTEVKIKATYNDAGVETEVKINSTNKGVIVEINNADDKTTVETFNHSTDVKDHDYSNTAVDKEISGGNATQGESRTSSSEREISPPREDLPSSEDSLRDVLRMQLSSLRNMKKSTEYLPELKNKSIFFDTIKKKRKPCDLLSATSLPLSDKKEKDSSKDNQEFCRSTVSLLPKSDINEESHIKKKRKSYDKDVSSLSENGENRNNNEENKQTSSEANGETQLPESDEQMGCKKDNKSKVHCTEEGNEDPIVSTSNETSFLIVNVEGGVDDLSPDETEEATLFDSESTECSRNSCDISPRTQIRNILTNVGSRRKRYTFSNTGEEKSTSLSVKKDFSVNFNEDPGIKKSVKNSEKSPFVSDSLEDFLNESSQLKISYPIPKLGAEEGITTSTQKSPYEDISNTTTNRIPKFDSGTESETPQIQKEKPKLVKKAKTLAEMRRRFEKMKAKQEALAKKEEARANKDQTENSKVKIEDITTPVPILSNRNCYLLYDNKKILLTGNTNRKCVTTINSKQEKQILNEKPLTSYQKRISIIKKPSLLSSLGGKRASRIKYKPGPLCKKIDLQNIESRDNWTTELKTLPKIFLEVTPEKGKPIDSKIVHLLPVFDNPEITEERLDFALTALKTTEVNPEPKTFNFHIPYKNNQEQFLVRRPCQSKVSTENLTKDDSDPEKEITNILNNLITYVETKEIENTLTKDEEPSSDAVIEKRDVFTNVKDKNRKRRRRIDIELSRLSCKVIDVGSTKNEDKDCSKPYCRLGCICKSLLCDSVFSNHCQLVECMFECKCPPVLSNDKVTNNALSAYTVNHLEDKAKKNLAKVEREFTQTVIHTDGDMILVGTGKNRRSSKPPKKYNDYVADNTIFECSRPVNSLPLKSFSLVAQKLDLNGLVPYCMFHKVHNCYCKGEVTDFSTRKRTLRVETIEHSPSKKTRVDNHIPRMRIVTTKYQNKSWSETCARVRKVFSEYKKRNKDPVYNQKLLKRNLGIFAIPENIEELEVELDVVSAVDIKSEENKKPSKRKQSFNVREDTVLLSATYDQEKEFALQRRKKKMRPLQPTSKEPSTYYSIFDGEIKVSLKENSQMLEVLGETDSSSLEYLRMLPWMKLIQGFQSRRINIWAKESLTSALLCNGAGYFAPKNFIDIRSLRAQYRTPIINWILSNSLPYDKSPENMRLILKPKNGHFAIAGYCMKKSDSEIVNSDNNDAACEEGDCASPKRSESRSSIEDEEEFREQKENTDSEQATRNNNINNNLIDRTVTQYETETTQKILSKIQSEKLKLAATPSQMKESPKIKELEVLRSRKQSVKLASMNQPQERKIKMKSVLNPDVVKKNINLTSLRKEIMPTLTSVTTDHSVGFAKTSKSPNSVLIDDSKGTSPNDSAKTDGRSILPSRTLKCTHRDMHNVNKTLLISYKGYFQRKLYFHKDETQGEITLALPKLSRNFKWWMIYLNSDFSYLSFVKASYSIKYTDLLDVVKMSNNIKSTITLKNKEFSDKYKHPWFGIFCCPEYQDRLFIGPFLPSEKHHIETFRYLQGKLIHTDTFNKMVGRKESEKKPMWIYENHIPTTNIANVSNDVIDITEEDDEENTVNVINLESDGAENIVDMDTCLLCPPFVEELTKEELASRHNINRYIMTNIPHLGYFRACQRDSKAIEVLWPKNMKGYRFPNVTLAKNLLVQYLSLIFCPIPQDFKINVVIMTHLDTQSNNPVDAKYFTQGGAYFCGEFGVYETYQITTDLLDKFNVPSVDSFLESHQNSEEHENTMIKLFGLFLMSNEELRKHTDPQSVLQWAVSEIYILKKLYENYESEKSDLQKMIRVNSCRVRDLQVQKVSQSKKVVNLSQAETIEITDSDDESSHTDTDTTEKFTAFQKICASGKLELGPPVPDSNGTSLKPKIWIKSTEALLKSGNDIKNNPSVSSDKAVTISLKNSNIVLNKNKMLITKIK